MQVFEWLMCSHPGTDSHRFMDAIDGAIEAGEAKSSKAYRTWAADVKSRKRPKNPVIRKAKKQKSNDDDQALVRAIRCAHAADFRASALGQASTWLVRC